MYKQSRTGAGSESSNKQDHVSTADISFGFGAEVKPSLPSRTPESTAAASVRQARTTALHGGIFARRNGATAHRDLAAVGSLPLPQTTPESPSSNTL